MGCLRSRTARKRAFVAWNFDGIGAQTELEGTFQLSLSTSGKRLSIAESLREGIAEEMRRDSSVFCMGEDIAVPGGWGGAFTVTLGLEEEFPDRMLNTPIAELGFFGAAVGAAVMGMRPIVDVQYGDFLFLAMDQIVNNAAKLRYMSGGTIRVPVVMRAPIGATGRGSQHAQSMERYFTGVPGIKVVAVSNAYDAKGILKSAVRDDNPVLIFEHKLLYGSKGARTEPGAVDATSDIPGMDYIVPLDRAAVRRDGKDVTILAWLLMAHFAAQAAEKLASIGIDAEVIDVRSLSPIDYETIGESVRKTGRVVIVEEGPKTGGVSAEIAAGLMERFGETLLEPVVRVASADVPVPFAPVLEDAYRPDSERIFAAAQDRDRLSFEHRRWQGIATSLARFYCTPNPTLSKRPHLPWGNSLAVRPIERLLMKSRLTYLTIALIFTWLLSGYCSGAASDQADRRPAYKITLDPGHPWRPPFGLERIGAPVQVVVESSDRPEPGNYFVASFLKGKQGPSYPVRFSGEAPLGRACDARARRR